MSVRRDRIARAAKMASETEALAKAGWIAADQKVKTVDRRREGALNRAGQLSGQNLPIGLQIHLVGAGARNLVALANEKAGLVTEERARRAEFEEAITKLRSLDRLIDRMDETARVERQRRDAADLQDLMAIRAARSSR